MEIIFFQSSVHNWCFMLSIMCNLLSLGSHNLNIGMGAAIYLPWPEIEKLV